jgi:hypothetical protein
MAAEACATGRAAEDEGRSANYVLCADCGDPILQHDLRQFEHDLLCTACWRKRQAQALGAQLQAHVEFQQARALERRRRRGWLIVALELIAAAPVLVYLFAPVPSTSPALDSLSSSTTQPAPTSPEQSVPVLVSAHALPISQQGH